MKEAKSVAAQLNDSNVLQLAKTVKYRETRIAIASPKDAEAQIDTNNGQSVRGVIKNVSRFGARIQILDEQVTFIRGEHISINLNLQGQILYTGTATVVNDAKVDEQGFELGITLYGEGIDVNEVNAILNIDSDADPIGSTKNIIDLSRQIRTSFKVQVADLSTILGDLKFKLTEEEKRVGEFSTSAAHKRKLEEHVINVAFSLYEHDIQNIFDEFEKIIADMNLDEIEIHKRYFRANLHALLLNAPFIYRAYTKPLGYAGDYGLMVMLYEYEDSGANLFEKFVHRMGCNAPSAVANKNRVVYLAELIYREYERLKRDDQRFVVSSIACGPAREVQLFLEQLAEIDVTSPVKAICLDQEEKAVAYAQGNLRKTSRPDSKVELVFLREDAVLGLIKKNAFIKELENSNVISCAGLFDYLSDRLATRMIAAMYPLLSPGGTMLIGNVSDTSPDRFSMDFLMEWKLLFRSPADMRRMVPDSIAAIPGVVIEVVSEPLGLNLFLRIVRPRD